MSRATDDQGESQPTRTELYNHWGITGEEAKKPTRVINYNAIQPWSVARDGSVHDATFTA
jgi:hypothetical protein